MQQCRKIWRPRLLEHQVYFLKCTVRLFKFSQRKRKQTSLMQELLCSSTRCAPTQRSREVTEQFTSLLGFDLSCTFSRTVHSSNPESESLLHAWLHSGIWVNACHFSQPIVDSFIFPPPCDCALRPPRDTPTVLCSVFLIHLTFCFSFLPFS